MENETGKIQLADVSKETPVEKRKFKLPNKRVLIFVPIILILGAGLYFYKDVFVVARVNGSFITRYSFNKELEAQAGQEALDSLIITKLIDNKVSDIEVDKDVIEAKIKETEAQFIAQGTTLEAALVDRNMSDSEFKKRITTQAKLEKLFADKLVVTDAEISQVLKDSASSLPKGVDQDTLKTQISQSIKQQKFSNEIQQLIGNLKAEAKIQYFIRL